MLLVVGLRAGRPIQIAPLALVNRVATAKRDDTPQVVQPTRCAALLKAALVLQLASAKLEDGRPGVQRVSIA